MLHSVQSLGNYDLVCFAKYSDRKTDGAMFVK